MNDQIPPAPKNNVDAQNKSIDAPPSPSIQKESEVTTKKPPKKLVGIIIGIVIFLIIVATFGVMGYLFFGKDNAKESEAGLNNKLDESEEIVKKDAANDIREQNGKATVKKNDVQNGDSILEIDACNRLLLQLEEKTGEQITESELKNELIEIQLEFNKIAESNKYDNVTIEDVCIAQRTMITVVVGNSELINFENKEILKAIKDFLNKNNLDNVAIEHLSQIMLISLENSKKKAYEASVKAAISSTLPSAILCMDDNGYLTTPAEGKNICRDDGELNIWPEITYHGGQWNKECKMSVDRVDGMMTGFEYCAILPSGATAHCSETGCVFNDEVKTNGSGTINQDSYADDLLTQDTMNGVVAKVAVLGCTQQYDAIEKNVTEDYMYDNNSNERIWKERWTVQSCGNKYPVDIIFTETKGQGTVWTIK